MTREEYLSLALSRYDELEALKAHDNLYDYEKGLADVFRHLAREYMESSLNESSASKDRRKKKLLPDSEK